MYPQGETDNGRLDSLDPDNFSYSIKVSEIRKKPPSLFDCQPPHTSRGTPLTSGDSRNRRSEDQEVKRLLCLPAALTRFGVTSLLIS